MKENNPSKTIHFLDSFKADTAVVSLLISRLTDDLHKMHYPRLEIDEIVIAVDEALTNAIQDTLRKQVTSENSAEIEHREITVRYSITETHFDATFIDHGSGLNIPKALREIPDSSSDDYFSQVVDYSTGTSGKKVRVMINGKEVTLKGIGAGLKILSSFMDTIRIDLIDKKDVVSESVSEHTDGTILTIRRKRRYS